MSGSRMSTPIQKIAAGQRGEIAADGGVAALAVAAFGSALAISAGRSRKTIL
jgi:hypothetical protein